MSKTIKVTPSYVPEHHADILSVDKVYTATKSDYIDELYDVELPNGEILYDILPRECAYLDNHHWIILEDQPTQPEVSMKRKHYDLIIAWANGAEIECRATEETGWQHLTAPSWKENYFYRIKLKTININGFEIPEPLYGIPEEDTTIYLVALQTGRAFKTRSYLVNNNVFPNGVAHLTEEACQKHIDALLSFTRVDK